MPADAVCRRHPQFDSCSQRENEKGKMEFLVTVPVDDAQFEVLERRYQALIG